MFKVEKIKEKLDLQDLEVNDSNRCKSAWEKSKQPLKQEGAQCCDDCCSDCNKKGKPRSYQSKYY